MIQELKKTNKSKFRKLMGVLASNYTKISKMYDDDSQQSPSEAAARFYVKDTEILLSAIDLLYKAVVFVEAENQGVLVEQNALKKPDRFVVGRAENISKTVNECFQSLEGLSK